MPKVPDLGRELAVIRPYLEILKVRMEGACSRCRSAMACSRPRRFPPMMLQSLVENAIKHGLNQRPRVAADGERRDRLHGNARCNHSRHRPGLWQGGQEVGTGIGLSTSANVWRCCLATRPA